MLTDCCRCIGPTSWQMIAASEPLSENPVPLAEPSGDDCSDKECSDEEEIPLPSAEQIVAQLHPSTVPCNAIASTSSSTTSTPHSQPGPLLEALTLQFVRCAEKEEPFTSSDEEEPLVAHGLIGKISRLCSHDPLVPDP